jgi:hypothetical protein
MNQLAYLTKLPAQAQLGRPPCSGRASCTDNAACEIVRRETGRAITPAQFRAKTGHVDPCTGLTAAETLRGLLAFGVHGYAFHARVTAADVIEHTEHGIVLVGVGYGAYPTRAQCEVGGRTDMGFTGAHATTCWGSAIWTGKPGYRDGRRVWMRDSDHHQDDMPAYDRFDFARLYPAMRAITTCKGAWATTFMLAKDG